MDGSGQDPSANQGPASSLPPPGAPPPLTPPQPPPAPTPQPAPQPARGLVIAAGLLAALAALLALRNANQQGHEAARAIGNMVGTVGVIALISWLFWRFKSHRAGAIAAVVAAALAVVSIGAQIADRNQTGREIEEAIEALDLPTPSTPFEVTDDEVDCIDDSGFDPDDLLTALTDTGTAGAAGQIEFFDVIVRCVPRALETDENVEAFRQSFSSGLPIEITDDEARCLLREIAGSESPSSLLEETNADVFLTFLQVCLSEEQLAILRGDPGAGPQAIGDDPALDRLAERCRDDDDLACDVLFANASANSEYSLIAIDCAGRGTQSGIVCAPDFADADGDGYLDVDAVGWAPVLAECRAGNMLACDFAFWMAPFESTPLRVGETCGERRAIAIGGSCVERYGEQAE